MLSVTKMSLTNRTEIDLLGEKTIPNSAYWGVHTFRAIENFPISGVKISQYPELIKALALVKKSAAIANKSLKLLDGSKANSIAKACDFIIEGQYHDQFVVDVLVTVVVYVPVLVYVIPSVAHV